MPPAASPTSRRSRSPPICAPRRDGEENAKLKLIAGVLGVPFNDLRQRELIAARRRARIWQGVGASLLLLAMLAAAGGWMAWRYAQHAEGLLAEAIRISADQVGGAVNVADQQGVSRKAIEELLARAKSAFNGLYRKTAEAPCAAVAGCWPSRHACAASTRCCCSCSPTTTA